MSVTETGVSIITSTEGTNGGVGNNTNVIEPVDPVLTNHGALTQLVAYGEQNTHIGQGTNKAYAYHTYKSNNITEKIIISRNADIVLPEYLELTLTNPDLSIGEIKRLIFDLNLKFYVGTLEITNFPLNLFANLNEPMVVDSKLYINLCFNMLFEDIKLLGLNYNEVSFKLNAIQGPSLLDLTEYFSDWGIVSKVTFLDTGERRQLASLQELRIPIQEINYFDMAVNRNNPSLTSDTFYFRIPSYGLSKGFFIEADNINHISNIKIIVENDRLRFDLNKFLILTKCKKISDTILYFPFNDVKLFSDRTPQSYEAGMNLSRFNHVHMEIKFDIPKTKLKIYEVIFNVYKQQSGIGGLIFCRDNYSYLRELSDYDNKRKINALVDIKYNKPIFKLIIDANKRFCPISFDEIPLKEQYMSCTECKNNFNAKLLQNWMSKNSNTRKCPMCKTEWTNFNVYINNFEINNSILNKVKTMLKKVSSCGEDERIHPIISNQIVEQII